LSKTRDHDVIEEMLRNHQGHQAALEHKVLNHFDEILVRPKDAVDWLRGKIADELAEGVL
jgi:hypothetical protein